MKDYRTLFKEAIDSLDVTHKPTLLTMLNPYDKFWDEYNSCNEITWIFYRNEPDFLSKEYMDAYRNAMIVDMTVSFPLMKLINEAVDRPNVLEAEEYIKLKIGNLNKYNFPLIEYITNGNYTNDDVWNLIIHILHEHLFDVARNKRVDENSKIKQLKQKKKDLYSCIMSKNKYIKELKGKMRQIRRVIEE